MRALQPPLASSYFLPSYLPTCTFLHVPSYLPTQVGAAVAAAAVADQPLPINSPAAVVVPAAPAVNTAAGESEGFGEVSKQLLFSEDAADAADMEVALLPYYLTTLLHSHYLTTLLPYYLTT